MKSVPWFLVVVVVGVVAISAESNAKTGLKLTDDELYEFVMADEKLLEAANEMSRVNNKLAHTLLSAMANFHRSKIPQVGAILDEYESQMSSSGGRTLSTADAWDYVDRASRATRAHILQETQELQQMIASSAKAVPKELREVIHHQTSTTSKKRTSGKLELERIDTENVIANFMSEIDVEALSKAIVPWPTRTSLASKLAHLKLCAGFNKRIQSMIANGRDMASSKVATLWDQTPSPPDIDE